MPKTSTDKSARLPRRPQPFFRAQTRSWYVQIGGRQIPLGRDRQLAWAKYDELMAGGETLSYHVAAAQLLDEFLEHVFKNRAASTYLWYRHYLRSFVQSIGRTLRVSELKTFHVSQWLDQAFGELSQSSRSCAVRAVKAAFNWAVEEGYLHDSPLKGVKRRPAGRRERVLSAEEFRTLILDRCTDQAERDLLVFLWETGARVQEVRRIAAEHLKNERIELRPSEDKVGHYRVIYLTATAREIIDRLSRAHPQGALFRNRRGRPWTSNAIRCRFRKLRVPGLCGTILRHSFCQRLLTSGVDSLTVAVLMGHRDLTMVARVYSHLAQNAAFLQQQLQRVATDVGESADAPPNAASNGSGRGKPGGAPR
jgi:integrase